MALTLDCGYVDIFSTVLADSCQGALQTYREHEYNVIVWTLLSCVVRVFKVILYLVLFRVVLAACSELLGSLLGAHEAQGEPVLVIDGAEPKHLKALLDYMYTGEMNVHHVSKNKL